MAFSREELIDQRSNAKRMELAMHPSKVFYFKTPFEFRIWLEKHHADAAELWVGYHKKATGKPSITWPESVDEALCFGWIDGVRKTVDARRFKIRFSPRKAASTWSAINIKKAQALIREGRMHPAGLKAFEARKENKSGIYSYEQRRPQLEEPYESILKKNKAAWNFFQAQSDSYKKMASWYVISAKREETRHRRLERLMGEWAQGRKWQDGAET